MIKSEAKWFLGKEYQNSVFVLADDSQDRLTQLNRVGMNPRIMSSKFQVEKLLEASLSPIVFVKTSAEEKARDVAAQLCKNKESYDIILGFHTVAVMGEKILKKPSTREEASSVLKQLSGRYHSVITGVALLHSTKRVKTFSVETEVKMGEIDEETLKEYVKDDEWIGKPAGYGIYYKGSTFIETNNGNFFNIMGIPVYETIEKIRKIMYGAKK
uniref:Uncharacterized protein n=1 Tax=Panagrolaimus superbus TaxID=310955 RepID=A0A914YRM8_9BILA